MLPANLLYAGGNDAPPGTQCRRERWITLLQPSRLRRFSLRRARNGRTSRSFTVIAAPTHVHVGERHGVVPIGSCRAQGDLERETFEFPDEMALR